MGQWMDLTLRTPEEATVEAEVSPGRERVDVHVALPGEDGGVSLFLTVPQAIELANQLQAALGVSA